MTIAEMIILLIALGFLFFIIGYILYALIDEILTHSRGVLDEYNNSNGKTTIPNTSSTRYDY